MALSEHEKTALEQIAQQLLQDDPKFASTLGPVSTPPTTARHMILGTFSAVAGCLVLLTGVAAQALILGIIGFTIMGAGAYLATMRLDPLRIRRRPARSPSTGQTERG